MSETKQASTDAGAGQVDRGVRRLSNEALEAARQNTSERIACTVYVAYSNRKAGWCVFTSYEGTLHSDTLAGPFNTREEAEALLGPAAPRALPGA
jgi:hypothetical protein